MRIKKTFPVAMLVALAWCASPVISTAADAALENMRSTVGNSRADLENYRKLLVEFEKTKLKANDPAGATAAKLEIIKLDRELAAMDGGSSRRTARAEAAEKNGNDKAAEEKAASEKAAAEKTAAEKLAVEKPAAEKAPPKKAATEKVAAGKAAAEKVAAEKAAAEKAAAEKVAAEKAAAEKVAAEKVAAEKVAAEKAAAQKAAAKKAAAEKAAAEKATAEKAAAEKAAAEKAAAEKAAAEKAAAEKAAAEKVAAEKAAAEKAAAEKAAAEKAAAEKAAAEKAATMQAAIEKAAAARASEMVRREMELKERLARLESEGNSKLNMGDVQGAREVKYQISVTKEELAQLEASKEPAPSRPSTLNRPVEQNSSQTPPPSQPLPPPAALPSPAPEPAAPEPSTLPAPQPEKPAATLPGPKTYGSSVQGLAGSRDLAKDNIYTLTISAVGPTSTLTYYAAGLHRSNDTFGTIWLTPPNGKREKIGRWQSSNFESSASPYQSQKNITDYKTLPPISLDISGIVKGPGPYQIEFEWTDGVAPLVIYRVEITS